MPNTVTDPVRRQHRTTAIDDVTRARIVALTRAGFIAADIADRVQVSERTVNRVRVRAGVGRSAKTPFTADEIAAARALLDDGCSYSEAARTIGRSGEAVARRIPGHGWTRQQCGEYGYLIRRISA